MRTVYVKRWRSLTWWNDLEEFARSICTHNYVFSLLNACWYRVIYWMDPQRLPVKCMCLYMSILIYLWRYSEIQASFYANCVVRCYTFHNALWTEFKCCWHTLYPVAYPDFLRSDISDVQRLVLLVSCCLCVNSCSLSRSAIAVPCSSTLKQMNKI